MKRSEALTLIYGILAENESIENAPEKILKALEEKGLVPAPPHILIPSGLDLNLVRDLLSSYKWEPETKKYTDKDFAGW
jgi:hypothetical protein